MATLNSWCLFIIVVDSQREEGKNLRLYSFKAFIILVISRLAVTEYVVGAIREK